MPHCRDDTVQKILKFFFSFFLTLIAAIITKECGILVFNH